MGPDLFYSDPVINPNENLQLYGGPSQRQASGTNQRIKALRQGRH